MSLIHWKENYRVEIEPIDEQHQGFFQLINQLYDALIEEKEKESLGPIIVELENYARNHFKTEEDYFVSWEYPGADKHRLEHETFSRNLNRFKAGFESGVQVGISVQLLSFLSAWLKNHILVSDQQYARFYREMSVK